MITTTENKKTLEKKRKRHGDRNYDNPMMTCAVWK